MARLWMGIKCVVIVLVMAAIVIGILVAMVHSPAQCPSCG